MAVMMADGSRGETLSDIGRDRRLVRALAAWFGTSRRQLPWRGEPGVARDPYLVLVSEVMLQQTQVSRVLVKFPEFVRAFSTVRDLAAANEDDVLARWSGLGYYRRARMLHAAARMVMERFGGVVPREVLALMELPGVGRYTAGAVASLAFGVSAPIVDGNVARVLIRIEGQDLSSGADGLAWAWPRAEALVAACARAGVAAGVLNEALMELGAMVCTPSGPRCGGCPVREECGAHTLGMQDSLPRPKVRAARRRVRLDALVVLDDSGRVLMEKQAEGALWSGLWQPPTAAASKRALAAELRAVLAEVGGGRATRIGVVERTLTHREVEFVVWGARVGGEGKGKKNRKDDKPPTLARGARVGVRWMHPWEFGGVGVSSACLALLEVGLAGLRGAGPVRSGP